MLLLDDKVSEVGLLRELITEAQAIVINTEPDDDVSVQIGLIERDSHLVIVIADAAFLAHTGCQVSSNDE